MGRSILSTRLFIRPISAPGSTLRQFCWDAPWERSSPAPLPTNSDAALSSSSPPSFSSGARGVLALRTGHLNSFCTGYWAALRSARPALCARLTSAKSRPQQFVGASHLCSNSPSFWDCSLLFSVTTSSPAQLVGREIRSGLGSKPGNGCSGLRLFPRRFSFSVCFSFPNPLVIW